MGLAHGTVGWADVAVPDMATGAAFYKGLFGWNVEAGGSDSMPYSMFTKGGQAIAGMGGLSSEQIEAGQPPVWSSYIIVDDADATFAKAVELGATPIMEPMDVMDAGRMFFVIDPVGAAVGFWQSGEHDGAQVFNEPGTMTWNEIASRDLDAAVSRGDTTGRDRLRHLRQALACFDVTSWMRESQQRECHERFTRASVASIYYGTFDAEYANILSENGWQHPIKQEVAVAMPRRFGKTIATSMWVAAYALTQPGRKVAIFSPGQRQSSMLLDLRAGRRTEIQAISGAVVRLGESSGVETPVNRALLTLVQALESRAAPAPDPQV